MAVYSVTYDLNAPGKDYGPLLAAIRQYPNCHALRSMFFIETNSTATEVTTYLRQFIDGNDVLYVLPISQNWQSSRPTTCSDWLVARAGTF